MGMKGTTSVAPTRGCAPECCVRSISSDGAAHSANDGFGDSFRLAGEGDDAAVVVRIAFTVEQVDAGDFAHGGDDGVDLGQIAAFGKIRNAFDEALHGGGWLQWFKTAASA